MKISYFVGLVAALAIAVGCGKVKDGTFLVTAVSTPDGVVVVRDSAGVWPLVEEALAFDASGGKPAVAAGDSSSCSIDVGSYWRNCGFGQVEAEIRGGKVVSRKASGWLVPLRSSRIKDELRGQFPEEFAVIDASLGRKVGELTESLSSREAYSGRSAYMDLYHTLAMREDDVDISFSAPLAIDTQIAAGEVSYGDVARIYPFDNSLVVLRLTGEEVRLFLEASYASWVTPKGLLTASKAGKLNFAKSPGNYDSASGLNYVVDLGRPEGERVCILSLAGGAPFDLGGEYNVALTSYRASGAGGFLKAAGIDPKNMDDRVVRRGPSFRDLLLSLFEQEGSLSPEVISDRALLGDWHFAPETVPEAIRTDVEAILK